MSRIQRGTALTTALQALHQAGEDDLARMIVEMWAPLQVETTDSLKIDLEDWRALLKGYMTHVYEQQGEFSLPGGKTCTCPWSTNTKEMFALCRIADEILEGK